MKCAALFILTLHPQEKKKMNTNQRSRGHSFFHGDYEYFEKDEEIYRSRIRYPIGLDGYRQARQKIENPTELFDTLIEQYKIQKCFTTWLSGNV